MYKWKLVPLFLFHVVPALYRRDKQNKINNRNFAFARSIDRSGNALHPGKWNERFRERDVAKEVGAFACTCGEDDKVWRQIAFVTRAKCDYVLSIGCTGVIRERVKCKTISDTLMHGAHFSSWISSNIARSPSRPVSTVFFSLSLSLSVSFSCCLSKYLRSPVSEFSFSISVHVERRTLERWVSNSRGSSILTWLDCPNIWGLLRLNFRLRSAVWVSAKYFTATTVIIVKHTGWVKTSTFC